MYWVEFSEVSFYQQLSTCFVGKILLGTSALDPARTQPQTESIAFSMHSRTRNSYPSYQDFQTYLESGDSKMLFMSVLLNTMMMSERRYAFLTALRFWKAEGARSAMAAASLGLVVDILGCVLPISPVGDQVWVIKNFHTPMVRVTDGESHHLLGGCYLHSQMHDEMLDSIHREGKSLRKVILP